MICQNCGNEIFDNAKFCTHCGTEYRKKTAIGFLLGFFLGLIGLIIGLCLYKRGTIARKTFMKGWWISFFVSAVIEIIGLILYAYAFAVILNSIGFF